jgi:hypothetical protein
MFLRKWRDKKYYPQVIDFIRKIYHEHSTQESEYGKDYYEFLMLCVFFQDCIDKRPYIKLYPEIHIIFDALHKDDDYKEYINMKEEESNYYKSFGENPTFVRFLRDKYRSADWTIPE